MKKIILFALILITGLSCQKVKKVEEPKKSKYAYNSQGQPVDKNGMVIDTTEVIAVKKTDVPTNWSYSEVEDKMTGAKMKFAELKSNNNLQFDMPYQGGSTSYLTIRKKRGQLDIYISVKPSQMTFNSNNENVKIRFDNNTLNIYSTARPGDGSSDIFFILNEKSILKKIKNSKKMLVEVVFYDHGTEILEFSTENLTFD